MSASWSPPSLAALLGRAPRGVLFTDIDGTLIDFETYDCPTEVRRSIAALAEGGIGTIAVTSKTEPEVRGIRERTGVLPLAITEGGGVLVDLETGERFLPGGGREPLARFVADLAASGWPVRGLSVMDEKELARLTGLPLESARYALMREASEPFVFTGDLPGKGPDALAGLAARAGYRVVRGGRLFHLLGSGVDKGAAVRLLLETVPDAAGLQTAAVGDAWNDLPMLEAVDRPFLLGWRVPEGETPPGTIRLPEGGPGGFVEAARRFLQEAHARVGD